MQDQFGGSVVLATSNAGVPQLLKGDVDAIFTYLNGAVDSQLLYIALPDQINLSSPVYASAYAHATYTTDQKQTFHGTPIAYSATILSGAANANGAAKFIHYLISPAGQHLVKSYNFLPGTSLVGGDKNAVPRDVVPLVKGEYTS